MWHLMIAPWESSHSLMFGLEERQILLLET